MRALLAALAVSVVLPAGAAAYARLVGRSARVRVRISLTVQGRRSTQTAAVTLTRG